MSYSEDNISAKSADMEYSVRARKRDQQAEQPSAEADTRRRRNPVAVPLPAAAERTAENESEADAQPEHVPARRRNRAPQPDVEPEENYELQPADTDEEPVERRRSLRRLRRNENDEQYTAQDDYGEEERPRRRSRRVEDEEQHDVQDDYAEEERPRRRSRRIEDEEQYDVQDDYAEEEPPRGNRRKSRRIEDDEQYYAQDDYPEEKPRNRFMAWLESLRIVEEIPDGEQDEYEEEPRPERKPQRKPRTQRAERGEHDQPEEQERVSVPVPKGRQRRAEIAEYSEDDPDEDTFRDERIERRRARRNSAYRADDYADEGETLDKADDVQPVDVKAEPQQSAPEQPETVKPANEAENSADEPKNNAQADDSDVDEVPVRRRTRNTGNETVTAPKQSVPVEQEQTESLEQRYINASVEEKRQILFDHWREQFSANLVIPAKPEKLNAITDMVRQILDACPDEYALGERWEKIDALLGEYSSAVVAEYGYRKLLASVQAEEKQRMYARPSEDKQPRRDRPQTPKLDDAKPAAQPASQPEPEQKAEKPAAPVRNSRKPQLDSYDDEEDYQPEPRDYSAPERVRRQYSAAEFDYKPERERSSGIGRLLDKVKSLGRRDTDYGEAEQSAPVGSRIKQLFRKGDVLDYSSDDEYANVDYEAQDEAEQYQRDEQQSDDYRDAGYSRDTYADDDRRNASYERNVGGYKRTEYSSDDRHNAGYERSIDSYARGYREDDRDSDYMRSADGYSSDDYNEDDRRNVSCERKSDLYAGDVHTDTQTYDGYVRPTGARTDTYAYDSAYADKARDYDEPARDNRYDYRDDVSEPDDYAEPNRSVYDESDEDYTPERPDYSHDYDDDDYRGGYSSNY